MIDYNKMIQEEFIDCMESILHDMSISEILAIPGVYTACADEIK